MGSGVVLLLFFKVRQTVSFSNLIRVLIGKEEEEEEKYTNTIKIGISLDIVSLVVNYLAVEPKPL